MEKFCSHPIPGHDKKKCDSGHPHDDNEKGFNGIGNTSDAKNVVTDVVEDIVNDVVKISQKKSEPDTFKNENRNCPVCQRNFKCEITLKLHMKVYHEIPIKDEVQTPCPHCQEVFWSDKPRALQFHLQSKHSLKYRTLPVIQEKSCPLCFKLFYSRTNVRRHILTEHENTLRIKCTQCDKSFASKTAMIYHLNTHSPNKEFVCEKCEVTFPNLKIYRTHLKQHNEPKKEKCPECDQILVGKRSLSRHLTEKHFVSKFDIDKITVPVYGFTCDQCDSKFKRNEHLKMHIQSQHSEIKKISCDMCGKEYSNKQNLLRHVKLKHMN